MSTKTVEFESAFSLAESVERLKGATRRRIFSRSAMAHESAVGRVSAQRVVLQRVIPMFGNSFKPFFVGRFVEREGRVFLVGRFRMLWLVRIFMAVWLGAVAVGTVFVATSSRASIHWRDHQFIAGAVMLGAGVALLGFGRWLSRNDPAWLSRMIKDALSAEKSVALPAAKGRFRRTQVIGAVCLLLALLGWVSLMNSGNMSHGIGPYPALARAMVAVNSSVLLVIAYGAFRNELFAWRLGLVFFAMIWLESVVPSQWDGTFASMPLVVRIMFIIGTLLVTVLWGWWWYAQRVHWQSTGNRGGTH